MENNNYILNKEHNLFAHFLFQLDALLMSC